MERDKLKEMNFDEVMKEIEKFIINNIVDYLKKGNFQ